MIDVYGVFIACVGAVFIFLLKDIRKAGAKLLFSFFLTFAVKYALNILNTDYHSYVLHSVSSIISVTKYIFFYLYLRYMTSELKRIKRKHSIYFLPLNMLMIYMLVVKYNYPAKVQQLSIHIHLINYVLLAFILTFLVLSFLILKRHHAEIKNYYSYDSAKLNLYWVVGILSYDVLIHGSVMVWSLVSSEPGSSLATQIITFYQFNETIALLMIMVMGIWQSNLSISRTTHAVTTKPLAQKRDPFIDKLKAYMQHKKPFLDRDLTVDSLAEQMDVKRLYLSDVINTQLNSNFFNFIREYRVNHVIQLMQEEKSENIKLLYLAYDSGFNSKSAFNRAFKDVTGKTPSEYLTAVKS